MTNKIKINKTNFIRNIIKQDIKTNKVSQIITRFPPEPNGYLHIGHAKSICLNFNIAKEFNGKCNLRFDDTNPDKEDIEYVKTIQDDIKWLGFKLKDKPFFTSDYFDEIYQKAILLIKKNKAYVCDLSKEEINIYRGTLKKPGTNSPYRERNVATNLKLFKDMKNGKFIEGSKTLRAKIDMASGNINLRDPILYRIKFSHHHRTGNKWKIYPMYIFSHPICDAIEKISHSLCTLEFQEQKPLYDWIIKETEFNMKPKQIEFSRLNLSHTCITKRKLKYLVDNKFVDGWDDPRMPTIKGYRRRGYTPESIRKFCDIIGISKQDSIINISILENIIRDELNKNTSRKNVVLNPIIVNIKNMPNHYIDVPNHPQNSKFGRRLITISSKIFIEKEDFIFKIKKNINKFTNNYRIRLLNAYVIQFQKVITDSNSKIIELECSYLSETLGGKIPNDGILPNSIIHWVDANNYYNAEIRIYNNLFNNNYLINKNCIKNILNKKSLKIIKNAKVEKSLKNAKVGERFQFNRIGYFITDIKDYSACNLVFNRIVSLKNY